MIIKLAALLMTLTITQVNAVPRNYDGRHVDVTGRALRSRVVSLPNGTTYTLFALCAAKCVHVTVLGTAVIPRGQTLTVHGTFYNRKDLGGFVLHGILVDPGTL